MLLCLCVLWSGEGCRVEINVKLNQPVVYTWGERRRGERGCDSGELGRTEQGCVCTSRWNSEFLTLSSFFLDSQGVSGEKKRRFHVQENRKLRGSLTWSRK